VPTDELQTHFRRPVKGLVELERKLPARFHGRIGPGVQPLVPGFDDFGIHDALLAFDLRSKKPQQVVGDADGDGLDALADLIGGPCLGLVELAFLLVERLLDVPAQTPDLVDNAGREGHLVGERDIKLRIEAGKIGDAVALDEVAP